MKRIILASNNAGKVREIHDLLAPLDLDVIPQGSLGIPEAAEPHHTFVENALAKARHAAQASGLPALADKSDRREHYYCVMSAAEKNAVSHRGKALPAARGGLQGAGARRATLAQVRL
ncbi:MAG: hypothetical protein JNK68_00070 [Betaproteobacteria bacterium]|nr:hypothetical protein [Betaproteobacteria bacterium]